MNPRASTPHVFQDFHPLGSALIGETHAENVRHAYVRAHFMNVLLQDPRVIRQFDVWGKRTGLYRGADRVAKAGDLLAGSLGLEHRGALFGDAAARQRHTCERDRQVLGQADRFCSRADELLQRINKDGGHHLHASTFVRDTLGLSWGWLAYELIDSFFRHVDARAFGRRTVRHFQVVFDPPAPPIDVTFTKIEGETLRQATARATQMSEDLWQQLGAEAQRRLRGRRPKGNAEHLGRYASWFYRHRVQHSPASIRRLAREYATWRTDHTPVVTAGRTDHRSMVQRGIKEAERLLGLGQYELKPSSPLPH